MNLDGTVQTAGSTQRKEGIYSDTESLLKTLRESGDCNRILDVLLMRESEGTRLANAATKRLETNGVNDKIGQRYAEIAGRALSQRDAVRMLLVGMCFKN